MSNEITVTVPQRVALTQAEGNESAQFALMDDPVNLAAVENAVAAGARWSFQGGNYFLAMPGSLNTLAAIDPSDDTADFGDGIKAFR